MIVSYLFKYVYLGWKQQKTIQLICGQRDLEVVYVRMNKTTKHIPSLSSSDEIDKSQSESDDDSNGTSDKEYIRQVSNTIQKAEKHIKAASSS